ncbi:MAG: hypothetical protein ACFFC7_25000 [Candidatus Hermodarchaeota archaeon]
MLSSINYLLSRIVVLDAGHEGEHMTTDMMGGMWGMSPFSPMMLFYLLAGLVFIFILGYLVYKAVNNQQSQMATIDASVGYQSAPTMTQQHTLPRYCPSCGTQVDPNDNYCFNCRAQLPTS